MLTDQQLNVVLSSFGSYTYLCVTDGLHPFWSHTRIGRVLHTVTPAEREVQATRGLR